MTANAQNPRFKALDANGDPLVGGLVYTYEPGTSTPKETYTDHTLGTAHENPIELDANGEATIFIDGNTDFVFEDASTVQQWGPIRVLDHSKDSTLTNATLAGTLTISGGTITWAANNTHSGNHTFSQNVTVQGNTTLGNASSDTLTVNCDSVDWAAATVTHQGTHKYSEQPGFSAYRTSAFNVGQSSTFVDVVYGTEDYDIGGCYDNSTGIFTAPVAGRYRVEFMIQPYFADGSSAGTTLTATLLKNGAGLSGRGTLTAIKTIAGAVFQIGSPCMTFSAVMTLAANDQLKWRAAYSDATSIQCPGTGASFSVNLVG